MEEDDTTDVTDTTQVLTSDDKDKLVKKIGFFYRFYNHHAK